jgi:hypothetical protein
MEGQPARNLATPIDRLADASDRARQKDGPAEKESDDLAIHGPSLFLFYLEQDFLSCNKYEKRRARLLFPARFSTVKNTALKTRRQ